MAQAIAALRTTCSERAIARAQEVMEIANMAERQMQILGLGGQGAVPRLAQAMTEAARCMSKLCPQLGDPRAAFYFLGLARQLQLVGSGSGALFDALYENLERCGVYELRLDTQVTGRGEDGSFTWRLASTVRVQPKFPSSGTGCR